MEESYLPAHSCKHCQRIVLYREYFLEDIYRIKLPHTGSEIRQAVEDGCELIRLFFFDLKSQSLHKGRSALRSVIRSETRTRPKASRMLSWKLDNYRSLFKAYRWTGSFFIVICKLETENTGEYDFWLPTSSEPRFVLLLQYERVWKECSRLSLKASPGIAAEELPHNIGMAQNPFVSSESSLSQAREWLTTCHHAHELCPKALDDFVPTRLLKLDDSDEGRTARLVETFPVSHIRWAALSYVWGGDQDCKTTISSLKQKNEKIDILELPRTLQDALTVCRKLGLEYLWVDSLCIVQDDENDLARELDNMPKIYQRAWVTISASTAEKVSDGFLHDRGYKSDNQAPISLLYSSGNGADTGTVIVAEARDYPKTAHRHAVMNQILPIHSRAWTYQERRLSPRILDFTHRNLTFICRTGTFCQGDGAMLWDRRGTKPFKQQQHSMPCLEDHDLPSWHAIVRDYAIRKLTCPQDKLRAIAALADLYSARSQQTYVAGLWRETLIRDLCWMIGTVFPTSQHQLMPRPTEYRAPSWSWAATDVANSMLLRFADDNSGGGVLRDSSRYRKLKADALLVDVTLQQNPPNTTYGQIRAGHLTLEGFAFTTEWSYNQQHGLKMISHNVTTSRDALEIGWSNHHDALTTVTALILTRGSRMTEYGREKFLFGLLLAEASAHDYRRVGTFLISRRTHSASYGDLFADVYESFERQRITIV